MSLDALLKGTDYSATPAEVNLRSLMGGLLSADWRQAMIARGYGWNVTIGTLSTGITGGGAGTVLDLDQPEFILGVPANYALIPLDFHIQVNPGLQTTDSHVTEILIAVDRTQTFDASGTFTSETPLNLRTNNSTGCPIVCGSAFNADTTDPVLSFELMRKEAFTDVQGTAATVNQYQFNLDYEPKNPPILIGPSMVVGYWGGSIAAVGFAQLNFIACPASLLNSLS
jgi:hypothetical protein